MTLRIGDVQIGLGLKPFIIAEMSGNHNQSLERAIKLVDIAAECGVDAVKLQTYTADTITLNVKGGAFEINDDKSLWNGKNLHDLYKEAFTPWEWHEPIMKHAESKGLMCLSSPFDETAVDFLEELGVPAFKIASFENNHLPLIRHAAKKGKPLLISTGMASLTELDESVTVARSNGCRDLVLLKCTSTYPATPQNSNILTIPHMRNLFSCEIGLSDHTMGTGVSVAAVAHGATVIEKHFTTSRVEGGVDAAFSLEPHELRALVLETERAWQSLGYISYGPTDAERKSLVFRRSLYVGKDMKKGDMFTSETLRIVRPGEGLHPRNYDMLIGRSVTRDIKFGEPVSLDMIS